MSKQFNRSQLQTSEDSSSHISQRSQRVPVDKHGLPDAGNQSNDHYKTRLSPLRYKLRTALLPYIRAETAILYKLQTKLRHPTLDFYFAWTANLASHTFYVLMLPPPLWFGASKLARDLVYVLGFGIYFTGFLKDFFCLPRPRSPPLHRITMSSYTTQEYGFPSSHAANATAVTLILLGKLIEIRSDLSFLVFNTSLAGLLIYYLSLIFGRLYCGMHGFLDILIGSCVGITCFSFRQFYGNQWDDLLFNNSLNIFITPILIIMGYISLIHYHSEPIDDCPCFDDSVAFVGVLIGLDLSHYVGVKTQYLAERNPYHDAVMINYDFNKLGVIKSFIRFLMGVILVVIWKAVSKPIIYTILPPIYKFIGIYLPRHNYIPTALTTNSNRQIRSASISNDKSGIGDINTFLNALTDHENVDEVGPETDIDYYAMLDYKKNQQQKNYSSSSSSSSTTATNNKGNGSVPEDDITLMKTSGVFKPRYDVEIVGRLIVYAGVATTAVWGFALTTELIGLN
ncbi:sphingolipid resistance protein [Scheffersomyces amazonensis]|uniref:sphingolipid resistance protein n=1 Tax=Scheffersomyces amazonensis TaxID=1078765 RepID=UPI00315D995D